MTQTMTDYAGAFTDDNARIEAALSEAHVPALMMALVHITGDTAILDGDIRPTANLFGDGEGDLSRADRAAVRAQALDTLAAFRDGGCKLPPAPDAALFLDLVCNTPVCDDRRSKFGLAASKF